MTCKHPTIRRPCARRGAAAILAMMFLVIFSSLAAAMAIVSQGNLASADTNIKVTRALASAETGMRWITYRLKQVTVDVKTRDGIIDATNAPSLWLETRDALLTALSNEGHSIAEPYAIGDRLHIGPISISADAPTFRAEFTPHPIADEDYDSAYYQRPPYSQMTPAVSNDAPLDATWVRVRVWAVDGNGDSRIGRAVQMDFKIDKKIRFALLSKSRVMIGRNVMIEGPVGSRFAETHIENGHPVQMASDFRGLDPSLDAELDDLSDWLTANDNDGDNRLRVADAGESEGLADAAALDFNGDGYIDEFDFFVNHYDANADGQVSSSELDTLNNINTAQLLELIDTFGKPTRAGYGDGVIDNDDRYAKVRGELMVTADLQGWLDGAAGGSYQPHLQGPIEPDFGQNPLTFEANLDAVHDFQASDFDTSTFRTSADGDLMAQALQQAADHDPADPTSPKPLGATTREEVPYGAAHPYDYYERPVFENMTFENVTIPKGTNALFKNCRFVGVTFVDTETDNDDPNFNYAGMQESDGAQKHPDKKAVVNGVEVTDTKAVSNNLRFDGCTFEGAVVSAVPSEYTHVRNKIAFTGRTRFLIDESPSLSAAEKQLYKRSTILAPHYSIEMGTFVAPSDSNETVKLSGTIVAGLIDMRGQVKVTGTVLTTFEPRSNEGPVIGDTSPQFNTTLGYFPKSAGDLEAELPPNGVGVIQVRYDPTLPLPDGILGAIQIEPEVATYFETGAE